MIVCRVENLPDFARREEFLSLSGMTNEKVLLCQSLHYMSTMRIAWKLRESHPIRLQLRT
jgi:hypothetical protein